MNDAVTDIPEIPVATPVPLPRMNTWRKSVHLFDESSAYAIRAALAADRPLLIRGESGTGKSQFARAAAVVLKRKFLSHVVNAHTEIQDLWYRFDAVSRLGDAQMLAMAGRISDGDGDDPPSLESLLDPLKYLSPGIFWWAYDHLSARDRYGHSRHQAYHPDEEITGDWDAGVVLLIDEIDKADADLPNSLLETIDNGKFTVPWMKRPVGADGDGPGPLVIITTNEDRELPGAFVRRCFVLNLSLPEDEEGQRDKLIERAAAHFNYDQELLKRKEAVLHGVAKQLFQDRKTARGLGVTPPGQAEYLDILHVLSNLTEDEEQQLVLFGKIADFALKKFPDMHR